MFFLKPRIFKASILSCIVFGLTACSFRAGVENISIPESPATFKQQEGYLKVDSSERTSRDNWWLAFNDEELNSLMQKALVQNLTLAVRLERLRQAGYRYSIDAADQFPLASLNAGVDRSQQNFRAFRNTSTNVGVSLPVSYELDVFRRNYFKADAAESEFDAARFDFLATGVTTSAELAETYFEIAEVCEQLDLLKKTIRSDLDFLELAESRYRDGVAGALDVHQAKQNLSTNKARSPGLERRLVEAQHRISIMLGEYPKNLLSCEERSLPRSIALVEVGVPTELISKRPDILASYSRLRAADARVAQAVAERFPKITLLLSGGYNGDEIEKLFRPENLVWSVAADLGVTLFDAGRLAKKADLERSVFRERALQYSETVLRGFKEVEDALSAVYHNQTEVALLEEKVDADRASLRVAVSEYLNGVKDYLPVLTSQVSLYRARAELLSARRLMLSSHVQLVRALGGGWSQVELNERIERDEDI